MSNIPSSGQLGGTPTNAQFQGYIEDFRDFVVESVLGAAARHELTIATGAVTPPDGATAGGGVFTIDTEGNAASDILDTITQTNTHDGQIIILMAENAARVVTVNHAAGGAGQVLLTNSADFVFGSLADWLMLQRRGTDWVELQRRVVIDGYADTGVSGQLVSIQTFTSSGTWTKPAGLRFVEVEVVGGGGGGGSGAATVGAQDSCGGGGGAGGYARKKIAAAALGSTETVTVGAGGAGGTSGGPNAGATGSTSSFGTHATATGGSGAAAVPAGASLAGVGGGPGGSGSGGDLNIAGGGGGYGIRGGTGSAAWGGHGGSSALGGGGAARGTTSAGIAGGVYGGGGGGAANFGSNPGVAGGAGAAGVVIVREYF